jgi:hypothetical protein
MTKYYTHRSRFGDRTAYIKVHDFGTDIVLKNGVILDGRLCFPAAYCEREAHSNWKEITEIEAKSLLEKPPITFTLTEQARGVLFDEIGLSQKVIEGDFISLIYRIQEAGISKGEEVAKEKMKNYLANI